jgi:hypothetical protein
MGRVALENEPAAQEELAHPAHPARARRLRVRGMAGRSC